VQDFSENLYKQLFNLAKATDEEVCGFILSTGKVLSVDNIAEDKKATFMIPPLEFLKYKSSIKAIYHSHPEGLGPSPEDKLACTRINVPFIVISLPSTIYYITPKEEQCLQLDYTDI
jgi:proteasome lid subunit RPN8/RPN11